MSDKLSMKNHRRRMKDKFIVSDFAGMAEHEILEFMLYFPVARIDTKGLARKLINTYGSIENVVSADVIDLMKIEGIGEHTAIFLKSLGSLYGYFGRNELKPKTVLDTPEKIGKYVSRFFNNSKTEVMIAFFLDKGNRLIKWKIIKEGGIDYVEVDKAEIVREAAVSHAVSVILAHNHPGGHHGPSSTDVDTTINVANALHTVNVRLKDHIVVADGNYTSCMDMGLMNF